MAVEIPRYRADPEQDVILGNGASVRLRAIHPDDEPRLMALSRRLSQRTTYQRFFSFRRLLPEEAHAFANVDYHQRMAIVGEVDDGAGADDGFAGIRIEEYGAALDGNFPDFFQGEGISVQVQGFHRNSNRVFRLRLFRLQGFGGLGEATALG